MKPIDFDRLRQIDLELDLDSRPTDDEDADQRRLMYQSDEWSPVLGRSRTP